MTTTIRTTDGNEYEVKETWEEINQIIYTPECLSTGLVKLNLVIVTPCWGGKNEVENYPITFIRQNITIYY